MARSVQLFTATVPAGTAKATPATIALAVGVATVEVIRWRVPPGPRGELGWQLAMGGLSVIPAGQGNWIVADDDDDTWHLADLPDEGEWQLRAYNTGQYDHSVYLEFLTTPVQVTSPATLALIPAASLSPAPAAPTLSSVDLTAFPPLPALAQ